MKLSQNSSVLISVLAVSAVIIGGSSIFQSTESPSDSASAPISETDTNKDTDDNAGDGDTPNSISTDFVMGEEVSILSVLQSLEIKDEEASDSYDRDLFKHWTNAPGSGCDARDAVLKEEAQPAIPSEADCPVPNGKWLSLYDGALLTNPSKLDIDHMVPLAEAWRSGAHAWNDEQREEYANDMGDPRALIAVSAGSNRSKSDKDPDEWLPEDSSYLCTYLSDWVAMKYRWNLSVDANEYDAIENNSRSCEETLMVVPEVALTN